MGRRKTKPRRVEPSLDQQLAELDRNAPKGGDITELNSERMRWAYDRLALVDAIRKREAARLADPGKDASGKFRVSPMLARFQVIERAPRHLRATPDSQFPEQRITADRIGFYLAHKLITPPQYRAARWLRDLYDESGASPRMAAAYDPDAVRSSFDPGAAVARQLDAAAMLEGVKKLIPYRARGVVWAVVIEDRRASDWAKVRGYIHRDSERHGMARLRQGLQGLVRILRY